MEKDKEAYFDGMLFMVLSFLIFWYQLMVIGRGRSRLTGEGKRSKGRSPIALKGVLLLLGILCYLWNPGLDARANSGRIRCSYMLVYDNEGSGRRWQTWSS